MEKSDMKRVALGVVLVGMLGACASTPSPKVEPTTEKKIATTAPAAKPASTVAVNTAAQKNAPAPRQDSANSLLQNRSVYFQFDQYSIDEQYRQLIDMHSKHLNQNPGMHVKVEGNADERGSHEYNLALGQKRADAVKKYMVMQGVTVNQIETMSWGVEKPQATGHDEAAWAKNRRADIVYPATSKK